MPDNYKDYVGHLECKLSKKFFTYKNNLFRFTYTETEYKKYLEKVKKEEEEKRKIEARRRAKEKE